MPGNIFRISIEPSEEKLVRAVIKAILKEAKEREMDATSAELVRQFIAVFETGERDFERLKALTLGAEIAPNGPYSGPAN